MVAYAGQVDEDVLIQRVDGELNMPSLLPYVFAFSVQLRKGARRWLPALAGVAVCHTVCGT